MGSKKTNLYKEFKNVTLSEWEAKIEKDLKGKSKDILYSRPEFDLKTKAYYHPDEFLNQSYSKGSLLNNNNNDWAISESFVDNDSKSTNSRILKALNEGTNGLKLTITSKSKVDVLLDKVLLEYLFVHIICTSEKECDKLIQYLDKIGGKVSIIEMPFLTSGLDRGRFDLNQLNIQNFIKETSKYCIKNIVINGHVFSQYGASSAQELGIVLSQLNEYFQILSDKEMPLELVTDRIGLHLGVTDNYFVNIAKFRAIKELTLQLLDQWQLKTDTMPWLSAETVVRHISKNDRYNNVLRQTSSAMSAALGGVNQLIISPYSEVTNNDFQLSARLAKNIQLILKEEAYLHYVIDPSAGSYAIESLTDQLITKAWEYFMMMEKGGGYLKSIFDGTIQVMINESIRTQTEALNKSEKTLLGVNKFQNKTESWISGHNQNDIIDGEFKGFNYFSLEQNFEKQSV